MGSRAKFRDPRIERLSQAIDEITSVSQQDWNDELAPETKPIYKALENLRDDPELQAQLYDRLRDYERSRKRLLEPLEKLQRETYLVLNGIFIDSESFKKEEKKGLRWVRS
jgi:hypothetical protein